MFGLATRILDIECSKRDKWTGFSEANEKLKSVWFGFPLKNR